MTVLGRLGVGLAIGLLAVVLPSSSTPAQASGPSIVRYVPPVAADVIDPFRPPAHIGAPGNRGLEYGSTGGQVVASAAAGIVMFAGPVAGRNVVTIGHGDGVRTTYSGLTEVWVEENQLVPDFSALGIAEATFHFGARIRDHYLDPQILLDASEPDARPRLIPPPDQ